MSLSLSPYAAEIYRQTLERAAAQLPRGNASRARISELLAGQPTYFDLKSDCEWFLRLLESFRGYRADALEVAV